MFGFSARRARPGRMIAPGMLNRPLDEVERQSRAKPGGGLAVITAAGSPLPYSSARGKFLVQITAVGTLSAQLGTYSWQAIYAVPGTPDTYASILGWTGSLGGDAMVEINGNSNLAVGDRVEVERDYQSGQVRCQYAHC
jgi:hypothetical protein